MTLIGLALDTRKYTKNKDYIPQLYESSIKTTEIYLKDFENVILDEANERIVFDNRN